MTFIKMTAVQLAKSHRMAIASTPGRGTPIVRGTEGRAPGQGVFFRASILAQDCLYPHTVYHSVVFTAQMFMIGPVYELIGLVG